MATLSQAPRTGSSALADRYREVRAATLALAEPLSAEDCALQSMPDASPTKWHLAHTSWYFETFVLEAEVPGYAPFHPAYRVLFNSYYNSVGEQYARPDRGLLSRPALADVLAYREHVDARVLDLLERDALDASRLEVARLGIHHEQQHQELILTDLKHLFSRNPNHPVYARASGPVGVPETAPPLDWRAFGGGLCEIGHAGDGFRFDNETPRHRAWIEPFELATRPVTNGEFLAFVEDGGYHEPIHWLSDGWATVQERGWSAPLYWTRRDGVWWTFTLGGLRELRLDEPVTHVSHYEADAFASWSGARLPSEAEWEHAAADVAPSGNLLESGAFHPLPARPAEGDAPLQLFGDVWEWTRSAYGPYPGYRPPQGALGEYNGKFMSSQMVLRGGSCATPESHVRATYRNFFYPDARWQFSGIRLARDARS